MFDNIQSLLKSKRQKTVLFLLIFITVIDIIIDGRDILNSYKMVNMSAAAATMLFAGTLIHNRRMALVIGMTLVVVSDVFVSLLGRQTQGLDILFSYAALLIICGTGFFVRRNIQRQTIMVASLLGSMLLFLFIYFGKWLTGPGVSENLLLFFGNNTTNFRGIVMGDLLYNLFLFGSYSLVGLFMPREQN